MPYCPQQPVRGGGSCNLLSHDALAEGESEDKDPITNAEHPYIAIISAEGENVKAPELPGEHTFTPLPKSDLPKLPDAPTLAMVDPGAEAASKAAVNAAMLSDKQLAHLFDINGVFCGSSFLDHPSLRICSRIFQTYHPLHELIQVSDESSIETHTTSSAHESNLAKYGCIEASVEVSTPWVGVSASYSHTHSTATFKTGSKTYTTAISRYPRAIIRLPVSSLKATDEFKEELKAALKGETDDIKRESLGNFFAKYGHAFPTEVHLGGHLHMTQTEESSGGSSTGAKETQIRAALTTAIHIGGSAAYSSKEDHDTKHAQSASSLGIEAVGGNTLLASNLALWPLSVMPYPNWRVTKLSKVKLITDIKTLFDDSQRAQVLKLFGPSARSTGHRGRDDDNDKPL